MAAKVLLLGNEFIKEDSLAKKIGNELGKEMPELEFINVNDSFGLIKHLQAGEKLVVIDVVDRLNEVREISVADLSSERITNAHDFDAGFFLRLLGDEGKIRIIGIPIKGDTIRIKDGVKKLLKANLLSRNE